MISGAHASCLKKRARMTARAVIQLHGLTV
nr:MAG TPA: hypothetical protein [Caudoviricetes sp.]